MKKSSVNKARKARRLEIVAQRIAVDCRRVIQGCLREEEWRDADHEFETIILAGLRNLLDGDFRGINRQINVRRRPK